MGLVDDIKRLIKDEDLKNIATAVKPSRDPLWSNQPSDTASELPVHLRKPVTQMTDEEIIEFGCWAEENGQSVGIGLPSEPDVVDKLMDIFECKHCGKCCVGPLLDGVSLMPSEIKRLAKHQGLSEAQFFERHKVFFDEGKHAHMPYPCPFLKQKGKKTACSVYPIRPIVCRMFPLDFNIAGDTGELALQAFCPEAKELFMFSIAWRRHQFKGMI